jgi:EAL domain-containing protein (putative c-di-GMP-specific phosphodiesterase class I)
MLEIEVVESVFLGRTAAVAEHSLRKLSAAGVRIALDDFGTGHASLSHLRDFPVDVIKIDQRFIRDLASDPDDRAIVRAMVVLGSSLSIQVVAEGIEHSAQADFLRSVGCHLGQGFLFAQAMAARRVPAFCRSSKRDAASPCPSSATSERT